MAEKLRRYKVELVGGYTITVQLTPDEAKRRYPTAVEVADVAEGDVKTKAPARRTRAKSAGD